MEKTFCSATTRRNESIHHLPFTALCRRRCRRWSSHLRRLFGFLGLGSGMAFEHSRRRKLTQFVPDHVLRNVNRNMALAVVHAKRQSHHVRRNGRTSRPGANHLRSLRAGAYALDCLPNTAIYFTLRSLTIIFFVRLFRRVLYPRVGCPHGVTGLRPPEVLPSPPPCGWSTGFIATPRTCGLMPRQRVRPALPNEMFSCSTLPTWPTVARHSTGTRRTSPEGMRNCA